MGFAFHNCNMKLALDFSKSNVNELVKVLEKLLAQSMKS